MVTIDRLAPAPTRPCGICGSRTDWRRERDGGWICRRCAHLPRTADDLGDAVVRRHDCSVLCCGDGEDDEETPAAIAYPARITASGPALLPCPVCRRWVRVLCVASDGALRCEGCALG